MFAQSVAAIGIKLIICYANICEREHMVLHVSTCTVFEAGKRQRSSPTGTPDQVHRPWCHSQSVQSCRDDDIQIACFGCD